MVKGWATPAAVVVVLAGCSGSTKNGLPVFPIGLYTAHDASELEPIREAGFDHVMMWAPTPEKVGEIALKAKRMGMGTITGPEAHWRGPAPKWPLTAWYIQDEPEVNRVSPRQLREKSEKVRAWDPKRKQVFVIGISSAAKDYASIADALMLDWYPVPHRPLESVEEQIDATREAMPAGKPLWFVVQAFDWRDDPPGPSGRRIGRFPDHYEIRFMSWAAVIHGVDGLFYFRLHRPNGTTLFDFPEFWQAVERVSLEMKAMKPIIAYGKPEAPPVGGTAVESRAWRRHGRRYVVIANRTRGEAPIPSEFLRMHWRPLFEARRDPRELVRCAGPLCFMRPYQVLVLESRLWPLSKL